MNKWPRKDIFEFKIFNVKEDCNDARDSPRSNYEYRMLLLHVRYLHCH